MTGSDAADGDVALVGVYSTPLRRNVTEESLEEMIFQATSGALADAGISIDEIDAIMLSTTDQVEGRVIESMVASGAVGGPGRDVTTLASAGEHAFVYGFVRIKAGQAKRVLIAVWSKESESVNPAHADLLGSEPFLLRPLGMTSRVAAGLQAGAYLSRHGAPVGLIDEVRRARTRQGSREHSVTASWSGSPDDPVAWPLREADLPVGCDAAVAAVMVAGDAVTDDQVPAWIVGVGWYTDGYELADRDLSRFDALASAAQAALGAERARGADVVEVQEISAVAGLAACEALGLAAAGMGADVVTRRESPFVNPSGGSLTASPGNAAGFLRIVAAAQQIRGRAGANQVSPPPQLTVGAAMNGLAGQSAAVVGFSNTPNALRGVPVGGGDHA